MKNYQKTKIACYLGFITQAIAANFAPLLFLKFHTDYNISLGNIALISTCFFFTQLVVDLFCARFVDKIGYTTYDALNDFALLESAVREDLNQRATRVSAVLNPVKLTIINYPENQVEVMEAVNNPEDESAGTHTIEFSRNLWMEREDFMEDAPKKFFRMTPGQEVRLKNAYIVKCTGCVKDEDGNIVEVLAEYDPDSKTGMPGSNRKSRARSIG